MVKESNYVEEAERVILELKEMKDKKGKNIPMVTTSKIRNLLSMIAEIYNDVMNDTNEKLSEDICERIEYLKIRFIYEAGREEKEKTVKNFIDKADILAQISGINGNRKNYILFTRYMEALVAYHKYYGGKD